jgi:hypothetical protein
MSICMCEYFNTQRLINLIPKGLGQKITFPANPSFHKNDLV